MNLKVTKSLKRDIINLSKDHTYVEIAETVGLSVCSVWRVLSSADKLKKNKFDKDTVFYKKAVKKYGSIMKAAKALDVSYGRVYHHYKK